MHFAGKRDSHRDDTHYAAPSESNAAAVEERHVEAVRAPADLLQYCLVVVREAVREASLLPLHLSRGAAPSVVDGDHLLVGVLEAIVRHAAAGTGMLEAIVEGHDAYRRIGVLLLDIAQGLLGQDLGNDFHFTSCLDEERIC